MDLQVLCPNLSLKLLCSNVCICVYIGTGDVHLAIVYDLHVYLFILWPVH